MTLHGQRLISAILALVLLYPATAVAWGEKGHQAVARVAATLLTPAARGQVPDLLGPTTTLADVANWADTILKQRSETQSWHYVDDPDSAPQYATVQDCPNSCARVASHQALKDLATSQTPPPARAEALKWVVHLVGDLHQPLHAGNRIRVTFFDGQTNLRRVWAVQILDRTYPKGITLYGVSGREQRRIARPESATQDLKDRKRWKISSEEQLKT